MTDLAYHHADTAQEQAAKVGTFADLDGNERDLYNQLKRDIQGSSILTILQRRRTGEYKIMIAPEGCHISGAIDDRRHIHRSAVLLDKNSIYCTHERLERLVQMVCRDFNVDYLELSARKKTVSKSTVHYFVYRIRY